MIIAFIFLMILLIYRNEDIFPNQFNLFHPENSFLALLVFTIGGSILFLLGLYRKIYRCKNEGFGNHILMLFALYDIMLGISLFVMRITGIGIYLIILNIIVILFLIIFYVYSRYYDISKYFDKNNENYSNLHEDYSDLNKECFKLKEYGNKCITYDELEKKYKYDKKYKIENEEDLNLHRLYLNLKQNKEQKKENREKKQKYQEYNKYKSKCKSIQDLNENCNTLYSDNKKKYICGQMSNDKCKENNLDGYYIKSCKPYNKKDNDTKCEYNSYYKDFNKTNLLISGEYKCNKLGMGVKDYKTCPYDKNKMVFECDPLYLNGSPIENNKVLEFQDNY